MADDDEWDFYPCRVDDAPATIFLNLLYARTRPEGLDTMYYAGLQILDPAEHGMGAEADATLLWDTEDAITAAAEQAGFTYVGRPRNNGDWQLTFYGRILSMPGASLRFEQRLIWHERTHRDPGGTMFRQLVRQVFS